MKKRVIGRRPRINKRWAPLIFPFLLSGLMTLLITGISVARVLGIQLLMEQPAHFVQTWLASYGPAWFVAYPVLLLVSPIVRKMVDWLTQ